jgi:hypothetical protein
VYLEEGSKMKHALIWSNSGWLGVAWVSFAFGNPLWTLPVAVIVMLSVWYHTTYSTLALYADTLFAVALILVGIWMVFHTPMSNVIFIEAALAITGSTLFVSAYYLRKADKWTIYIIAHTPWHFISAGLFGLILYQYSVQ